MLVEHASVAKPFASPSLRLKSLGRCPCFATVNCLRNTAVKVVARQESNLYLSLRTRYCFSSRLLAFVVWTFS